MELTDIFRALSDPTRLAIYEFLCRKCSPVAVEESGQVRRIEGVTVGEVCCHITGCDRFSSRVSHHLRELRLAGLISATREGKYMLCSIRPDALETLSAYFADLKALQQQLNLSSQAEVKS